MVAMDVAEEGLDFQLGYTHGIRSALGTSLGVVSTMSHNTPDGSVGESVLNQIALVVVEVRKKGTESANM